MSGKQVALSAKAIIVSGLQVRETMDRKHVDEIAELFDEDNPTWPDGLPPVIVFHDGKCYFLADGHHRLDAAVQSGCTEIRVEVHNGTMEDALRHACGANASHGLKRTNPDKRNAVRIAYQLNPGGTDASIARICKVSQPFVSNLLRELKGRPAKQAALKETSEVETYNVIGSDNSGSKLSESESDATKGGGGLSNDSSEDGRNIEGESEPAAPNSSPVNPGPVLSSALLGAQFLFDEADRLLKLAAIAIDTAGSSAGGELLRSRYLKLKDGEKLYSPDLENLRRELKHWRPHSPICPVCNGIPSQSCNLCLGLPYLTRGAYDRLTDSQRAKLEKVQGNDAA